MWYQYDDGDHHDANNDDEKFIKNADITKHKTWSE